MCAMRSNALQQISAEVVQHLDRVIDRLGDREPVALAFFLELRAALNEAVDEADLVGAFMLLSTAAFRGFRLPDDVLAPVDDLLAQAERIAHAFTAPDSVRH